MSQEKKLAVLIDSDNVSAKYAHFIMAEAEKYHAAAAVDSLIGNREAKSLIERQRRRHIQCRQSDMLDTGAILFELHMYHS